MNFWTKMTTEPDEDLVEAMEKNQFGKPMPTFRNLQMIWREDRRWAGSLGYCGFRSCQLLAGRMMTDDDVARARVWLDITYGLRPSRDVIETSLTEACGMATEDPLVEYLLGLEWDGKDRLSTFALRYLGAKGPMEQMMMRKWLLSAVARGLLPGCKADVSVVLVGRQGQYKSAGLMSLVPFGWAASDAHIDVSSRDGSIAIQGKWIHEFAELSSLSRKDAEQVKQFMSATTNDYRPVFGRRNVRVPRRTVFYGTTNDDTPLRDETGSRRFWPIKIENQIDVLGIKEARDQVWAQAVHVLVSGLEQVGLTLAEVAAADESRKIELTSRLPDDAKWWMTNSEDEQRRMYSKAFESKPPYIMELEDFWGQVVALNDGRRYSFKDIQHGCPSLRQPHGKAWKHARTWMTDHGITKTVIHGSSYWSGEGYVPDTGFGFTIERSALGGEAKHGGNAGRNAPVNLARGAERADGAGVGGGVVGDDAAVHAGVE